MPDDTRTTPYRLPDGRIVGIYTDVAQGAARVGYQLADGTFVVAVIEDRRRAGTTKSTASLAAFVASCAASAVAASDTPTPPAPNASDPTKSKKGLVCDHCGKRAPSFWEDSGRCAWYATVGGRWTRCRGGLAWRPVCS